MKKVVCAQKKTTLIFSKITQWGGIVWKLQKISKISYLFFYIFLNYSLQRPTHKIIALFWSAVQPQLNFNIWRKKLLFFLLHDIERPNLTFFLCFNVKIIKKSCLRPGKTSLIFSKIIQHGGIVWKFQKISKILYLFFNIFLEYSL